jgi:two-component system response regulator TtrR
MHRSHDMHDTATVFVVDPDPATDGVIADVLEGSGLGCEFFRSGRDFLAAFSDSLSGCLVLEQRIPDMSGLQLQQRLSTGGCSLPMVFILANSDVSTAVELMRRGAVHVLEKPARPIELFNAIQEAVELDRERRRVRNREANFNKLTATLTRKDRETLHLIAKGRSCKAMASELDLSVRAVELRRNSLMKKLGIRSSLDLMRFAVVLQPDSGGNASEGSLMSAASA